MSTTISQFMTHYCSPVATALFDWLLPYSCIICDNPIKPNRKKSRIDLCHQCSSELPWIFSACYQCAIPLQKLAQTKTPHYCGQCLKNPPPFEQTHALFHYQEPINHLIADLKFHNKLIHANLFGKILATYLDDYYRDKIKPDLIVPIPLHPTRLIERGYNQALELARTISKQLNIPIDFRITQRIRSTQAQSSIPAKKRNSNIKNAFSIKERDPERINGKYILVVDDVITTGNTVREFSHLLRKYGVARIELCSVARTTLTML